MGVVLVSTDSIMSWYGLDQSIRLSELNDKNWRTIVATKLNIIKFYQKL
jgi:hypothetical protein